MKILMVTPAVAVTYGGTSKIVLELAQALGCIGVSVDVVTTNANGATSLDYPLNVWISEKFYRIQYFYYSSLYDYKFSLPLTKWLFNHAADYDLVHTSALFSYPVLSAHWICQKYRVPYIMTPHGMLEPWALSYKAWKKRIYYTLFEKPALQNAQAIQITASPEAKGIEILGIKTPLVLVPNGIHKQEFEALPNPTVFYQKFPEARNKSLILFLGRIDPKKGIDLLASAFAKAHKQFPETHLVVAGPDNIGYLSTAQGYFAAAGCLNAVTFTGMLAGPIKYAALAAARVYIAPSYSEGFSMSVLEGMAAGLPCIITTGCNFPEAVEAKAAKVVNIDADEIANALIHCLKQPQQAKEMGDRARHLIFEKYTWEQIALAMIKVYETVIDKHPISTFK